MYGGDSMFIKDRGNIKWTSLMLVEHKKALKKLRDNMDLQEKPELDEQELKRLNRLLIKALKINKTTSIIYYSKGKFKKIEGIIEEYLPFKKEIMVDKNEEKVYLDISTIFEIEIN